MRNLNRVLLGLGTSLAAICGLQAQTVLINPAQEGGFELPGGFAGNGWTVENGTAVNQWHLGALALPSMSGNVAYVSNDGGVTHNYDVASISVVHLYRNVVFPAGEVGVTLSFDVAVQGEGTWDQLMVSVADPATPLPVSTTTLGSGAMPAPFVTLGRYSILTGTQRISLTIPPNVLNNCAAPSTLRLVFTWKNDGSFGTQPPAAIDNIQLVSTGSPVTLGLATYTINNTAATTGTNFNNFADAVAWLNALGACNAFWGPITFNVSAGQTFTHTPLSLTASGSAVNTITFQKSGTGANPIVQGTGGSTTGAAGDAILSIVGGDYFRFNGIDFQDDPASSTTTAQMEYGIRIVNASATDGAQNNLFENMRFTMSSTGNTSVRAIVMTTSTTAGAGIAATAATGANSNNVFRNIEVVSGYGGFRFLGTTAFPDENTLIEDCIIGASTANSLGGSVATNSSGIRIDNQNNATVRRNIVQNLTVNTAVEGIYASNARGLTSIHNNQVRNITNASTSSTAIASGIRIELATGVHSSRVYNNFVANVNTLYTGSATATRIVRGIFIGTGGSAGSVHNVDFNSVNIVTTSTTASSSAFELGSTSAYVLNVRNNIFVNASPDRTGVSHHVAFASTSATAIGAAGSISNNNVFFVPNSGNGFISRGNTTNYTFLADHVAAFNQDLVSQVTPPLFTSLTDLHVSSADLNGSASMTGITWVTDDIDGQTRVAPHDIGADDFTPTATDLAFTGLLTPTQTNCYSNAEAVLVRVTNFGFLPLDFTTDNATVSVNVTGAATQTFNIVLNNNSLNAGLPLATGEFIDVPMGNLDMTAPGVYTFNGNLSLSGDGNAANNTMPQVQRNGAISMPVQNDFTGFTGTNLSTVFPGWSEAAGNPPAGSTANWVNRSDITGAGVSAAVNFWASASRNDWILSPLFNVSPNAVLSFDLAARLFDAPNGPVPGGMGALDTLRVMIIPCGQAPTLLAEYNSSNTVLSNTDFSNFRFSLAAYAGQNVIIAFHAVSVGQTGTPDYWLYLDNINICQGPAPADLVLSSTSATTCEGVSTSLSVASPNAALSYQWFDVESGGLPLSTTAVLNVAPTATGNYYLEGINGTCASVRSMATISVNPSPAAPSVPAPAAVCEGTAASASVSTPAGTYTWYDAATGGNVLGTGNSFSSTFAAGSSTVHVEVADANGCISNRTAVSFTTNANPTLSVVTATSVCTGQSADLTATASAGTVEWFDAPNAGTLLGTGSPFNTGTLNTTTTFYPEAVDANGCRSARSLVEVLAITVPTPSLTAGTVLSTCQGQDLVFNATGASVYVWEDANGTQSGGSFYLFDASIAGVFDYELFATDGGSCSSSVFNFSVTVTALPAAATVSDATICAGNTATLTANSNANWFDVATGGTALASASANFTTPQLDNAGTVTYYAEAVENGCASSTRTAVTVTVEAAADASFSFANATYCIGAPNPTPTITGVAGGSFSANNGLTINGLTGEIDLSTATAGNYTVTYSVTGANCPGSATFDLLVEVCSGLDQVQNQANAYLLFPNPNSGQFSLRSLGEEHLAEVEVIDVLGKVVFSAQDLFLSAQGTAIQTNQLVPGAYIVRIRQGANFSTLRMIIKD